MRVITTYIVRYIFIERKPFTSSQRHEVGTKPKLFFMFGNVASSQKTLKATGDKRTIVKIRKI